MNLTDLIEKAEEKFDSKSVTLIAAGVLALGVLITWRKKLIESFPDTELPPIIIKTGSLIIETNKALTPNQFDKRIYKRSFRGIKGIRVVTYNEQTRSDSDDDYFYEGENNRWKPEDNVKVFVELERCLSADNNDVCNSWSSPDVIEILNNASDLEIKVPTSIHLSKSKNNKKNRRSFKHEDENDEFIRFTKVTIINTSQGNLEIKKYPINSSEVKVREYYIAFYDEL